MFMDYLKKLQFHYQPKKGWRNDPNGLVFFKGYYHVFYQHAPNYERPWHEPMCWGHARTKDFLTWEELPVALWPDKPYDKNGCWSGTAIVKDDVLYLFYASISEKATVSVAYSKDGVNFTKYAQNPVINDYPSDGGPDFRDPAVCFIDGVYYCLMATGHPEDKKARLLLYRSSDLLDWQYVGITSEWDDAKFAECPSFIPLENNVWITASVCRDTYHFFTAMYGKFINNKFVVEVAGNVDRGPDQYAGQAFKDDKGRVILISWVPGWDYDGFAAKDIGCMSTPRELFIKDEKVHAYPIKELQHLLKDNDPSVVITDNGFVINREGREPAVYTGVIKDLKILRDEYMIEVFVNGGEAIYTCIL